MLVDFSKLIYRRESLPTITETQKPVDYRNSLNFAQIDSDETFENVGDVSGNHAILCEARIGKGNLRKSRNFNRYSKFIYELTINTMSYYEE